MLERDRDHGLLLLSRRARGCCSSSRTVLRIGSRGRIGRVPEARGAPPPWSGWACPATAAVAAAANGAEGGRGEEVGVGVSDDERVSNAPAGCWAGYVQLGIGEGGGLAGCGGGRRSLGIGRRCVLSGVGCYGGRVGSSGWRATLGRRWSVASRAVVDWAPETRRDWTCEDGCRRRRRSRRRCSW